MQIVYNGPHPEVVIDELDQDITAGEPVEIPDDLAARLLEQSTWQAADKKAEKAQATIDKATEATAPVPVITDTSAPADDTTKDVS